MTTPNPRRSATQAKLEEIALRTGAIRRSGDGTSYLRTGDAAAEKRANSQASAAFSRGLLRCAHRAEVWDMMKALIERCPTGVN